MSRERAKRQGDERRPFTTEAAEDLLRRHHRARRDERAARLRAAALEVAGEEGYAALSVQKILDRAGVGRSAFYALFAGKDDCFLAAYEEAADDLERALLGPCREAPSWLAGLEASLAVLARLLTERPARAAGVLAEARVAGGAADAKRAQVLARLAQAIDGARRDAVASRHAPPPTTAPFVLAAIESAAVRSLRRRGPDFAAAVPDLIHLAAARYLDAEVADEACRRARG